MLVRVPDAFVRKLAEIADPASVARKWQETCDSVRGREVSSLAATLAEMRDFAVDAIKGPGIVGYRNS